MYQCEVPSMYYSDLSRDEVTEIEAHMQIIELCERWYNLAHPNGDFVKYFKKHPDLLSIEQWPCFMEVGETSAVD